VAPVFNVGGWLLLSALFSALLLLVQRAERNRRLATLFFVALGLWLVAQFGVFRISTACQASPALYCEVDLPLIREPAKAAAYNTANAAFFTALVLNFLFFLFIGRYNPPKSSDDIKVLGLND
jgi:hypothetical protein